MASQTRQDRQQMRQRGAGARNVANTNFDLSMPAAENRADRQQMRQRGAGNRKVNNIDFGFSFPTPSRSRRSTSKASNTSDSNRQRISKTTARRSREPSASASRRSTSNAPGYQRGSREPSNEPGSRSARPSKSRRVNTATGDDATTSDNELSHKQQQSRRSPPSMFAVAEVPDEPDSMIEDGDEERPMLDTPSSPMIIPQEDHEKENAVPGGSKPAQRRKKRKSIGQQSMRKSKRSSGASIASNTGSKPGQRRVSLSREQPLAIEDDKMLDDSLIQSEAENSPTEEAPADRPKPQAKRKRKRKSVVFKKRKRPSTENVQRKQKPSPTVEESVHSEASGEEDGPPARAMRNRPRLASPTFKSSPVMRSIEVEDSEDEYVDDETPEPPTPAPVKKATKRADNGRSKWGTRARTKTSSSRKDSTFPILTHRMTNIDALPTVHEDEEMDSDEDASRLQQNAAERSAPNVVDVLAQICRETVETAVDKLDAEGKGESRAVRHRKRSALGAFGVDLDSRLFDISAAVEDRIDLEAQVRKVKRQKADLQAQWIEVRRQRERVALRCDRVRREHWESEQAREEKWRISEAARRAELELERNPAEEEASFEFLLRSAAEEVTTSSSGGGLLGRLKGFNKQLEKMAGMLEGRTG